MKVTSQLAYSRANRYQSTLSMHDFKDYSRERLIWALTPNGPVRIAAVPKCFGRIAAGPWRGISCAQSESVRSAASIAMPDSMGAEIPTARHRRMSERP